MQANLGANGSLLRDENQRKFSEDLLWRWMDGDHVHHAVVERQADAAVRVAEVSAAT